MEAICTSETSVKINVTARRYIPEKTLNFGKPALETHEMLETAAIDNAKGRRDF
jgi:hypothetical protein